MEKYPPYQPIFSKLSYGESQMLEKAFYEKIVKRLCLYFELQFYYGVFFAYMRLREQEIGNLIWISECVAQNQKYRVKKAEDSPALEPEPFCYQNGNLALVEVSENTVNEKGIGLAKLNVCAFDMENFDGIL